jgi:hypothetical protein
MLTAVENALVKTIILMIIKMMVMLRTISYKKHVRM